MATEVPFTILDELILHLEGELGPWNIQLEVEATGPLEVERVRDAIRATAAAHPMARAARRSFADADRGYVWEVADELAHVPLDVVAVGVDGSLDELRRRHYSPAVDLTEAPPLRAQVVRDGGADGDLLMLNVSHVPCDGIATLRLLRSITTAYRGGTIEPDPVDLATSREAVRELRPRSAVDRLKRLGESVRRLPEVIDPPTRIARVGASGADGFGFVHRTLPVDLVAGLVAGRAPGVSVNDRMLAALHLTIDAWNRAHGEGGSRVSIVMPMNARPTEWFHEVVGMYAVWVDTSTQPADRRDPRRTVEVVSAQTNRFKTDGLSTHLLDVLDVVSTTLPVGLKRRVAGLLPALDHRFVGSALLSNLGRLPAPTPRLDDGREDPPVWFSPPCMMPLGVGLGVATVGSAVHVVTRYRLEQFDAAAAGGFTDLYAEQLAAVSG